MGISCDGEARIENAEERFDKLKNLPFLTSPYSRSEAATPLYSGLFQFPSLEK